MKPNISIIIPVYNVETYLADCLDSILAQTFESFEVILVDDGSTDGSPAIAQKYADAHSEQIRYYRKENGGPGLARNFGISKAKGDYLMFVDSDDIVDPEMLTDLYESAFVLESDIIFCPYFRHGLYQEVTIEGTYDFDMDKVYTGTDFLKQSDYTVTTCSKLYRTAFVKQFAFPAHWFEDVAWLPVVMSYAKKISYVSTPYYHYLRHDTSIVSSTSNKQILGSLDAIRFIVQNANPEAASDVAPFTASLTLYMCTRRPAFADRYVDLLMENKDFILSNTNFEEHPRLKVRLDYYYNAFQAIPKHIYYDHFGKTTLTEQEQNNLDTLVGTLVEFDAKITCLNEENCDIDEHPAIRKAYDEGRYHVVGQYFKCKKLMEEGGIALSKQVRGIKYITPLLLRTQGSVNPMLLVQHLSEKMDDDAIYVADVGQNQLWSADNYVMKNGRFLTSGGMGTMGYSIPAGIGAKMCTPDKQVVVVCGDGSFQMSMYELGTIAVNKVPIKILVMRNHYLGLVREHQEKTYEEHYFGVQLYDYPKYAEIAAAYDMDYFHCDSNETLDAELDRFLACDKACIMVCEVDSHNNTK